MSFETVVQFFNNNRNWKGTAVLIFGIALVLSAAPLEAGLYGDCLNLHSGMDTNCSANEGSISGIEVIYVSDGCISATDTALVKVELTLSSGNTTRYDVGLYVNVVGGSAQTDTTAAGATPNGGACFHEALFNTGTPLNTTGGQGPFFDADSSGQPLDVCGETDTQSWVRMLVDGDIGTSTSPYSEMILEIACVDNDSNGYVDFEACSAYSANTGVECTSVLHTVPSAKSKCGCLLLDTSNSTTPIGFSTPSVSINCTPDQLGPGDTVSCTVTYANSGSGPADNVEFRIDFPESLGTVGAFGTSGTDAAVSNGDYISLVPGGGSQPSLANIPAGTTATTFAFDFTVSDTAPDGPFTIDVQGWYDNGTPADTHSLGPALYDSDTTQVTPAVVSDFTTHRHRGQTLVQWETAAETGTAGFYLERRDLMTGQWVRVNEGLLPALLERPGGGTYAFLDSQAKPLNSQTYRLVAVDFTGESEIHGPFERRAEGIESFDNFDAMQSKGFARMPHRPSTASVAAWDAKRQARVEELRLVTAGKGLTPGRNADSMNARMRLSGEGLFTLSASMLADQFGMDERKVRRAIKQGNLTLHHDGSPVAYLTSDSLDQVFFFGQEIDSRFTDENTYWASFVKKPGSGAAHLMDEIGGIVPAGIDRPQTFLSTTTLEEDIWLLPYAVSNPEADIWFGGFVSTGYYGDTTYVTAIQAPDASGSGQAEIRLQLYGLTNLTAGDDHHAEVRLNGALIGEVVWDGVTPMTLVAGFDQSILHEGDNTLEVNGVLDGDVEQSSFVIDTIDLTYNRHYRAVNDQLIFGANGHRGITVDGFTGPDVEVFDLRSASRPLHITSTNIEASGNGYRVTFAPASADGSYLAVRQSSAADPSSFEIDRPSNLRSTGNAGEYIVIAPASLHRGAQALIDYRQQRFPTARLIDLQDIYDEFNAGVEDPSAISSFLKYALGSWQTAPRFVTLAGKGTLDPKDIQGFGTNVLPLVMTSTPFGLFASDSRLADVFGADGVPDVAIGRIPALSSAELKNYVNKLRTFESTDQSGGAQAALMLADNADDAGDFPADSLNVGASLPADITPIHVVHQAGADADLTRQQVSNVLDQGVMLFNFIGHGAVTQLGSEAFWAMPDIGGMNNNDHLPVFAAFSCYSGNGTFPGYNSITEEMTLLGSGGVIAALAPTGLSINNRAIILNQAFVSALLDEGKTVGEATQSAIESLHLQGGPQFMQEIYNVVGDPAIEINR